ncbi:MAG: ribonuclease HI [Polyangiaceae bacterium]
MPWVVATLRGQKVFARARTDGALAAEGGRVEVRYKPNDGRAYRAAVQNLEVPSGATVLDDDHCGPADRPDAKGDSRGGAPSSRTMRVAEPVPAGAWIAYSDGACSGNPGPAGSGVVIVSPAGKTYEGYEWLGEATNNVAELTAILRAVEWIPAGAGPIVVHTDSQYAIGVLQKGWKAKANQDLVARAKKLVADRKVRLVYVPGHSGVPLNERADELARQAVSTARTDAPRVEA